MRARFAKRDAECANTPGKTYAITLNFQENNHNLELCTLSSVFLSSGQFLLPYRRATFQFFSIKLGASPCVPRPGYPRLARYSQNTFIKCSLLGRGVGPLRLTFYCEFQSIFLNKEKRLRSMKLSQRFYSNTLYRFQQGLVNRFKSRNHISYTTIHQQGTGFILRLLL